MRKTLLLESQLRRWNVSGVLSCQFADEEALQMLLARLESMGFRVTEVEDGERSWDDV